MIWNLEKLQQERLELIEVIDNLKRWERFSIEDRPITSLQITAHMMRLSELDEDLANLRSEEHSSGHRLTLSQSSSEQLEALLPVVTEFRGWEYR